MKRFCSLCLALMVFSNGFTDLFNYKNIPILIWGTYVLISLCVLLMACSRFRLVVHDRTYYLILFLLVSAIFLSYYFSARTPKGFSYFLWFNWIIIVYGVIGKLFIDNVDMLESCIRYIRITLVIHAALAIIDWLASNGYFPFSPLAISFRGQEVFGSKLFGMIRLRGGVEEAAHYGLYLNIFFPLSLLSPCKSKLRLALYIGFVGVSYLATLSLAAWGCAVLALVIGTIALLPSRSRFAFYTAVLLSTLALIGAYMYPRLDNQLINRLKDPNDISRVQRLAIYDKAADAISSADRTETLFGYGPAAFIERNGTNPVSWYMLFAHDLGVPAMVLACMTGLFTWFKVLSSHLKDSAKLWAQVSLIAPFLHYAVTGNFWHPWIWTAMAILLAASRSIRGFDNSFHKQPTTL
jgi:hypothetical protein